MDETRRVELAPDALVQELADGEAVILHLGTEVYYSLDPVALAMWKAVGGADSIAAAREQLAGQFDVDDETLRQDLHELLSDLHQKGLIRVV